MTTMVIPREAQEITTNSSAIRELRKRISLNSKQVKVLIGALLGDGSLIPNSWKKNYRLSVQQCNEQKSYVLWKHEIFKEFVIKSPQYQEKTNSWRFRTISHKDFNVFRKLFYPDGYKRIPINIDEILNDPLSLAVWYMDDGSLNSRKDSFILNTQSFSIEDNLKLQNCLRSNFGLNLTINRDKKYFRLYVSKKSAQHFQDLIKDYVIADMRRKLVAP